MLNAYCYLFAVQMFLVLARSTNVFGKQYKCFWHTVQMFLARSTNVLAQYKTLLTFFRGGVCV